MNYGGSLHAQKIEEFQRQVEQLRCEVHISRQKISVSAREIVSFCEKEERMDPLLVKMPDNPFRPKRNVSCTHL